MYKFIIILLFYFVVFVFVRAQNSGQETCDRLRNTTHSLVCKKINACGHVNEILKNGKLISCGFEGKIQRVCCLDSLRRAQTTTGSPAATTTSPKTDSYRIAREKCVEYAEARYANKTIDGLYPGAPSKILRQIDCVKAEPLVVGGNATIAKEFPHMALIGYKDRLEDASWDCAGTLISDMYVLSAAHCRTSFYGEAKWVRLGERILDSLVDGNHHKDYAIVERIVHPGYKSPQIYNDIALYKLNSSVVFNAFIRPICLYTLTTLSELSQNKAVITGWGITAAGEQKSDALLKATINFINPKDCVPLYDNNPAQLENGFDTNSMLCAGNTVELKGTCQGDSGGPIQVPHTDYPCMWHQIGITSFGSTFCGTTPSIYTKVSYFIPWIQQIVWPLE